MNRYSRSQLEHLIEEWVIGANSKRNKEIIRDRLIEGMELRDLAHKYDLSEEYSDYSERDYARRGSYDDGSTRGSYRDGSYDDGSFRGSYGDSSMRDGSYARGRGRNAKRDSMGRYSTDSNMMLDRIHDMMAEAPDERTRQELQKFMTRLEQM